MAVLTPPNGSALKIRKAGRYGVQVWNGTDWIFVNGLTSYEPKYEPTMEDDTDITSNGWASEAGVGNKLTVAFEGLVKGTEAGGVFTPDPGLQKIIDATASIDDNQVRMRHWRLDGLAGVPWNVEFYASVNASPAGGKPTELQKFSGTLSAKGEPTLIVAPAAVGS